MGVAKQLFDLQEIDLEIESGESLLARLLGQLGESQAVAEAQSNLARQQAHLEELQRQQRSAEWEIDSLEAKIATETERLYSGKIKNPKELASLQQEVESLKAKRSGLETTVLETMDRVEQAEAGAAEARAHLHQTTEEWKEQQQQASAGIERIRGVLAGLRGKRQAMLADIDPESLQIYEKLRAKKGKAISRVEQGICSVCRISLPFSELQQVRSGGLVQCSSCGRMLFLP